MHWSGKGNFVGTCLPHSGRTHSRVTTPGYSCIDHPAHAVRHQQLSLSFEPPAPGEAFHCVGLEFRVTIAPAYGVRARIKPVSGKASAHQVRHALQLFEREHGARVDAICRQVWADQFNPRSEPHHE